ncbi:fungal-specific transcription factor domain-containing protein [Aspergillus ambiguus]|uniref:fungal specific transcription factor domain-containing protein n=1 Tax=Aspergillus ambiguus TaxID=176160 RepID=UPI003CCE2FEA
MESAGNTPVTAKLRAARRRPPRASRACETCRIRKTKTILLTVFIEVGDQARIPPRQPKKPKTKSRPSPWPEVNPAGVQNATETPELCDSASREGLSGVNIHTNGTEFYGNSSNLAFLGNLYARARGQAENRALAVPESSSALAQGTGVMLASTPSEKNALQSPQSAGNRPDSSKVTGKAQLSIVNLLYNPTYASYSPPQADARPENEKQKGTRQIDARSFVSNDDAMISLVQGLSEEAQLEIEKMFISSYFSNKHYIHPMLCKPSFMQRCEKEAFVFSRRPAFYRGSSKFSGLYFAVVALGAINASPNETSLLDHYCTLSSEPTKRGLAAKPSALDFADFYFGIAKQALGDLFESSSLESAQALLLLSVFCQNALRPHSCFMYSGMAVRTAVAIGLASGMSSLPPNMRREACRTWWCIYSHEIEMCCSSGRLDSMKDLQYYQVSLPKLKATPGNQLDPDAEDDDIGMIPAMVALAQIMSEASHLLYHSPKRSTSERSQIAMTLDGKLLDWKSRLPGFLNIDAASLNDTEWAFKQKLVLRLRFYNTFILIHRPFLAVSTSNTQSPNTLQHVYKCLDAARTSVRMQYESFLHRIYIRTWWYNTTYALYGAMILLHLVLSGVPGINDDELLMDVDKSLDIFESMNNIVVARRCAEMIREVLEVARTCVARRRAISTSAAVAYVPNANTPYGITDTSAGLNNRGDMAGVVPTPVDNDFFLSLFNQDSQPDTRAEILANLVDPTILEDFAFGNGGNDFSYFLGS